MALKDWKKVEIDNFRINYHKIGQNITITYFEKDRWIVDIFPIKDGKFSNKLKSFKTKSQALAYARSYMRKH